LAWPSSVVASVVGHEVAAPLFIAVLPMYSQRRVALVDVPRIEVNGGPATADQLAYPAIVNFGHFTAMQVRGGAVRGLGLHLSRLDSATRNQPGRRPGARTSGTLSVPACWTRRYG
jgi:hypothetical protein